MVLSKFFLAIIYLDKLSDDKNHYSLILISWQKSIIFVKLILNQKYIKNL